MSFQARTCLEQELKVEGKDGGGRGWRLKIRVEKIFSHFLS